jgi:hypothetical protein
MARYSALSYSERMGTGREVQAGIPRPARDDGTAEVARPVPPGHPSAVPLTGMDADLADLRWHWSGAFAVAACVLGGTEVWTAARLDTGDYVTASDPGTLELMIRASNEAHPVPRRDGSLRDHLTERLRAQCPGWAVVRAGDEVIAVRGTDVRKTATEGAMRAVLDSQRHQDARAAAGIRGAGTAET